MRDAFAPLLAAYKAFREAGADELALSRPWALLSLIAVALLILLMAFGNRRPAALAFSRGAVLAALPMGSGHVVLLLGQIGIALSTILIAVALAGPTAPGEPDPAKVDGIDIVAVLDLSTSMRAADFKPRDRLYVAKRVIAEHLLTRETDRIGLVVFAGQAFTQAPLTHDKRLLSEILEGVKTGVIEDGTAIGDAIATGVNRLRDSKAKSRVMILVTDGDNNAGSLTPEDAAKLAKEFGVKIYPILVGRGGRVPYPVNNGAFGTDYRYMEYPVNPELLEKVADVSGGEFFNAADPRSLETSFKTILEGLDKSKLEAGQQTRRPLPLDQLLALPAFFLLLLSLLGLSLRGSPIP